MRTKKEIREEIRRRLGTQSGKDRLKQSRRVHRRLYRLAAFRKSKCLLIYVSLAGEVDTLRVIDRCLSTGKRVVVPRMDTKERRLNLREIRERGTDLEKGPYGVMEPRPRVTRRVSYGEIDCAVVPGIAFDRKGNRLGRGGGFFDRLLSVIPKSVPRIALAFDFQVMERLPIEFHDQPVDIVLSS